MEISEPTYADWIIELAAELSELSKQQSKALQASPYILMSTKEAHDYNQRRLRIGDLCNLIGKFRPSRTGT
jgi:hypothetical protein